ncbi:MAG TPA: hypothetical protein VLA64_02860 [Azonexus sp.]|nr:hypothetical protein [Azonexus sp.]
MAVLHREPWKLLFSFALGMPCIGEFLQIFSIRSMMLAAATKRGKLARNDGGVADSAGNRVGELSSICLRRMNIEQVYRPKSEQVR